MRVLVILICCLNLFGCNTVAGFGQDLQKGGHELQKIAQ